MHILKNFRRKKEIQKIEEELSGSFTTIANAMKSGLSLPQALQIVGQEKNSPLAEELRFVLDRVRLGLSLEEALLESEKKLKIGDYSLMVHSIVLLRQIGGNFVAHFEKLAGILREREKVSGKIRLYTTQGLTQGILLGVMPLGLGFGISLIAPDFLAPLWQTPLGWILTLLIFSLDVGGYLWMRRLARVSV